MRVVTKKEYLKAIRTVKAYEKQQQKGKYQFLYWLDEDTDNDPRERLIDASNIDAACKKFLLMKSSDVSRVDHEVMFEGEYIDITNKIGFENLI